MVYYSMLWAPWSAIYLLGAPFIHAGLAHLLLNIMGLHFIGGQLVLPSIGARRFLILFALAALFGGIVNNILGNAPAVGISAAVLGMFSCSLYRFAHAGVKLLLIHDLLRLRPFALWKVAAFIVGLDICGIIFNWQFFAHWAHLAGFLTGGIYGWFIFDGRWRNRWRQLMAKRTKRRVH